MGLSMGLGDDNPHIWTNWVLSDPHIGPMSNEIVGTQNRIEGL